MIDLISLEFEMFDSDFFLVDFILDDIENEVVNFEFD